MHNELLTVKHAADLDKHRVSHFDGSLQRPHQVGVCGCHCLQPQALHLLHPAAATNKSPSHFVAAVVVVDHVYAAILRS